MLRDVTLERPNLSERSNADGRNFPQIIFEDDEIIAVSKPPGMVVHPAPGSWNGTFVNALVFHLENNAGGAEGEAGFPTQQELPDGEHNPSLRPGIVHRLDKGTTGVLLAAKNPTMQAKLAELFAKRQVTRPLSFFLFFLRRTSCSRRGSFCGVRTKPEIEVAVVCTPVRVTAVKSLSVRLPATAVVGGFPPHYRCDGSGCSVPLKACLFSTLIVVVDAVLNVMSRGKILEKGDRASSAMSPRGGG